MFKSIYFIIILIFFSACASNNANYINNYLDIEKSKKIYTSDNCTFNSFILENQSKEYGKIFVEYINLNFNCSWHGLPRSYFDDLFKEKNNIKSMNVIERLDIKNFEFTTYLIDNKYILNLIYDFSSLRETFIIDYKGVLFTEMIQSFDSKYVNNYLNKERYFSEYNNSLVSQNIIGNYFSKEIDRLYK